MTDRNTAKRTRARCAQRRYSTALAVAFALGDSADRQGVWCEHCNCYHLEAKGESMTDQELAVQRVAEPLADAEIKRRDIKPTDWADALEESIRIGARKQAEAEAGRWWPLIVQAREDGKAEGRREAAEAIEWVRAHYPTDVFPEDSQSADAQAARFARTICATITGILARGAQQPDEKERTDGQ